MKHSKLVVLTLLFLPMLAQLKAAAFELDLRAIDNKSARVYGPGVDLTFLTSAVTSVTITTAGTYTIEIDYDTYLSARIQMQVGSKGAISNIKWMDADSSQTSGSFVALPSQFYTLENAGKRFLASGINAWIDLGQVDISGIGFPQAGVPAPNPSTGKYEYKLFPGDYRLFMGKDVPGEGNSSLEIELMAGTESWSDTIFWVPYDTFGQAGPAPILLPSDYFFTDTSGLGLTGKMYQFDIQSDNDLLTLIQAGQVIKDQDSLRLFPGNYTLLSGTGSEISARYALLLDASTDSFRDTVLITDSDSSLFGAGEVLGPQTIYDAEDTLHIVGSSVYLNLQRPALGLNLVNGPAGAGQGGMQTLKLLPGDYWMGIAGNDASIVAEIRTDGKWGNRVYYLPPGEKASMENLLHGRIYTRNQDSLDIHGMPVAFNVTAVSEGLDFKLLGLEDGEGDIADSAVRRLLPGEYLLHAVTTDESEPTLDIAFTYDNKKGGLSSRVDWKDLVGDATGGVFVQYPPEDILAKHGSLVIFSVPGGPKTYLRQDYAVPERTVSGAWYQLTDAKLWFKYEGEYDPGQLQAKVLNWRRHVVMSPGALSLTKEYGDNRFMINCSSLSTGHYTLELTNEKNETFYVRFEKN